MSQRSLDGAAPAATPTETVGVVVVDKPAGWTSHDVVARCRRIFGQRRVGHAGTLDPGATGLLLVGLGRATRLLRFLTALEKTYRAEVVLGTATSTLDDDGDVVATFAMPDVTLEDARAAAEGLTGDILQVPPMVSAVRIGGQRLHELARQGREVERPARPVTVRRFAVEPGDEPGILRIEVACSSGTYVRVLAADLGAALGGGAHLRRLRRVRVGSFTEADARPLEDVDVSAVRSPAEALVDLRRVVVPPAVAEQISRGRPLERSPLDVDGAGPWAMVDEAGTLLAVYEPATAERMAPAVVLSAH
jgi:tRNA pseudouridine55 synthase